jgi:hypothetical protein
MGKTSNRQRVTLTNRFDGQSYFVSIVRVSKRIRIPLTTSGNLDIDNMSLGNIDLDDINMQAAIYPISVFKKNIIGSLLSKPLLVINLDDALRQISIDDFKAFVITLLTEEKLEDLYGGLNSANIFKKYDYVVTRYDIWSLFSFSKVKNLFIFRKN